MNTVNTIPDWLGAGIIAIISAALGFLGRQFWETWAQRRKQKNTSIEQLEKLKRLLDESKSVFQSQNYMVRRLTNLLMSKYGAQVPHKVGYDETFYQMYDQMDDEQRELFALIRGTTQNSMHHLNEELRQWDDENPMNQLFDKKSETIENLDTQLDLLRKHLNGWFDKYEAVFKTSERRSLVYLNDEKRHGEPFPSRLGAEVDAVLAELNPHKYKH